MKEEWICIKEYKSNGIKGISHHLKGDKIFVSNTGKVKLNDIELTLDKGLYINDLNEICIVGCGWPYSTFHRTVYTLFVKEPHHDVYHNIHHIDGNHYNNNVNNLIELTAKEHGQLHADNDYDWGLSRTNEFINSYKDKANEVIELTKKWLLNRVVEWFDNNSKKYREKREKDKLEKNLQKQKEIEEKISSGNYTLSKDGRLVPKTNAKKGYKMPDEEREKHSIATKQAYINDPTLVDRCHTKEASIKISNALKKKRTGSKLITKEDGTRTWKYKEAIL